MTTINHTPIIPGYQIREQVYCGSRTTVYRAIREKDALGVVIKVLATEYPSFNELLQFRNQYTVSKNLKVNGIVHPLALEPYGNGYLLVMEDTGGISLREYLKASLSIDEFLIIVIQLANILHSLHQNRVIHKDIKPANILINIDTKQIQLIDFSIASLLPRENQEIKNPNVLEGTLAYISPEQTGRMNRGIDYRSDFYSLGVTFYELLAGELPFIVDDPMELVHCHIAKQPPNINIPHPHPRCIKKRNGVRNIPQVIADIIAKLMAKNAEDRYQSALGLKHDLENCLHQLNKTGKITNFEIGQHDLCDRFLIPEKLYGRENEVTALLAAFNRVAGITDEGKTELILVAGFSGIGKTAVVSEVHKPIVKQRGYFIKGKFDQFNRNIPLSAFVQSFRNLMRQLLSESDTQLSNWRNKILQGLGDNGQVLIDVIPELERIIGKQPPTTELPGNAAQNRFNLLFQKFIQVFTTKEHPLVIFLDDLQWADSASLKLIQLLVGESQSNYLLIIGAYRDNEVSPIHPLMMLTGVEKTGAKINTISLLPLNQVSLRQLVADTLSCSIELAQPLTDIVYQKTQGNPFFATQFLKALYQDKLIAFDGQAGYWQCDISKVREAALTDDVVELMTTVLLKLPDSTQDILKLAAYIGNQFDLNTLAIISEKSQADVADALWNALQSGLILPQSQVYKFYLSDEENENVKTDNLENLSYRFLHDRVQQAAYSLVPIDQKQATHAIIAQLLLTSISENDLEANIFEIVSHFNAGISLITKKDKKFELARLNFIAGCKAKAAIAYDAALKHFNIALELLTDDAWEANYELTLAMYEGATETAYLCGNFEQMQRLGEIVLSKAKTVLDRIKVYEIEISAQIAQTNPQTAIALAISILKELGIDLPIEPSPGDIQALQTEIEKFLPTSNLSTLANLPPMTDETSLAALRILNSIYSASFVTNQSLFALVIMTQVKLSILHGNDAVSSSAYAGYGCLMTNGFGQPELGYQAGILGLELAMQFGNRFIEAMVVHLTTTFIFHQKQSLREYSPIRQQGILAAIESGNLEILGWHYANDAPDVFFVSEILCEAESKLAAYGDALQQYNQTFQYLFVRSLHQTLLNLLKKQKEPCLLVGEAFNEVSVIANCQTANTESLLGFTYTFKVFLGCIFDNAIQARDWAALGRPKLSGLAGNTVWCWFHFYDSLAQLGAFESLSPTEQSLALDIVAKNEPLLERLATQAPVNYQAKLDLVKAEHYRVLGQQYQAMEHYDRAIAMAKESLYLQEEALANELAAKFYLNCDKQKLAAGYMQEAYYCYARWGAGAKISDLEQRYPELLRPILQFSTQVQTSSETPVFPACPLYSSQHHSSSDNDINQNLDYATLIKVSHTISSTIDLNDLMRILTRMMLENSGADKCALILCQDKVWQVRAIATLDGVNMQPAPLENNRSIPSRLIQYVKHTQKNVVINNLKTNLPVIGNYLTQNQPKSVLAMPILNQGQLIGILYLENSWTSKIFTSSRISILNFLCTQAAISLENARLYQQAQIYAQQVEQSQLQMVQNEKMASLGNLVAGVAHEVNNPIGFLNGSINNAKEYVQDLIAHLQLYQQHHPQPAQAVQDNADDIDLEFLIEDLPKLLDAMTGATNRVKSISTSLRTFSRADTDHKVSANLHNGIDSTLLILKYRLKANEFRPAIAIHQEYGEIPLIECFPSQLNQVFMNILANAIDMFDEIALNSTFAQLQANPQEITIRTELVENQVYIRIRDNGKGISEDIQAKIFDHLFTTKSVGKGTGLGLAIARQIVEEKHGGTITVNSVVGEGTEFVIALMPG